MTKKTQKNIREIVELTDDSKDALVSISELVNNMPSDIKPYKRASDVAAVITAMMIKVHALTERLDELEKRYNALEDDYNLSSALI